MLKRSLIIVWKWQPDNNKDYDISGDHESKVFCYNIKRENIEFLLENVNNIDSEKKVLLLHKGEENHFDDDDLINTKKKLDVLKNKVYLFGGGEEKIYFNINKNDSENNGLLNQVGDFFSENYDNDSKFYDVKDEEGKIKKSNFEFVWDWYWNKLDLEYQKKKIIDLWLPLAIDIQGLSEVENGKRDAYLKEVLEELDKKEKDKSHGQQIIDGWNEVKKVLLPEKNKEVLEKKYWLKEDGGNGNEKAKIKFPVERVIRNTLDLNSLKEYVKTNVEKSKEKVGKENDRNFIPEFLPNWLQEVVGILDEKIKQNK